MDMPEQDTSPYKTLHEVAAWYRVSGRTVQRWIVAGCPAVNVGSRGHPVWRLELAAVQRWLTGRQRSRQ